MTRTSTAKLDPVTFEVLKNAFSTIVDQMAEQILRTCHSFVIYSRDFSSALCDPEGNTIMQGSQDIAVHVGTLHLTARAVVDAFGERHAPRATCSPSTTRTWAARTSTTCGSCGRSSHEGELICLAESNGHWADMGGSVPGSFDVSAQGPLRRGRADPAAADLRPGVYRADVVRMIVSNTRAPDGRRGRLHGPGRGDGGRRARDPAPGRQVRARHGRRRRSRRCRTTSSGSRARGWPSCPTVRGRPRTTSTSTRPRARAWSRSG